MLLHQLLIYGIIGLWHPIPTLTVDEDEHSVDVDYSDPVHLTLWDVEGSSLIRRRLAVLWLTPFADSLPPAIVKNHSSGVGRIHAVLPNDRSYRLIDAGVQLSVKPPYITFI